MIRKILLAALVVVVTMAFIYRDLLGYGIRQGVGQLHIIWNARSISEVLADEQFPDSLKKKLVLVNVVKRFAIDSLGLKDTRNYSTVFDQRGKEVMWVVTACEPFRLVEKQWEFPVLGSVPYKGFFKKELALQEKARLERDGWDVNIRNPGGWSTLGWFTDPILSKMLERSEGDLASLIIHEMVHATLFVKDSADFNENLASFIGDRGAELFLIHYFGKDSKEYQNYLSEDKEFGAYADHILRGCNYLDSVYRAIQEFPIEKKMELKNNAIQLVIQSSDSLLFTLLPKPSETYRDQPPNNAYFMSFKRYHSKQDVFYKEWTNQFQQNLKQYVQYLSGVHPSL
jgi:predicted aminopeptidase